MNPTYVNPNRAWQENVKSPVVSPAISSSEASAPPAPMKTPAYVPYSPVPFTPVDLSSLKTAADSSLADIGAATDQLATKEQRRQTLEGEQGIPELGKQLSELSAMDAQYAADLTNLASRDLQQNLAVDNATNYAPLNAGMKDRVSRNNIIEQQNINIKRSTNAAAIAAANGRLTQANEYVSRAIDYEFKPLEAKLEYKKLVYENNKERYTQAEQRQYEAGLLAEQHQYEDKKQTATDIKNVMLQAAASGADAATIAKIQGAKTAEEAISYAGTALGAEFRQKLEQQKFENNLALRSMALDEAKFAYQKYSDTEAKAGRVITAQTASGLADALAGSKIGQATKTSVGTILGVISATEDLAKNRQDGKFAGFYPGAGIIDFITPDAWKRTETLQNEGYLNAINLKVQQWASGATLTESQTKLVQGMVPKKGDSDKTIQTKMNNLTNFMNQQIKGSLLAEGITYEPQAVNLFQPQSLDSIFKDSQTSTTTKPTK